MQEDFKLGINDCNVVMIKANRDHHKDFRKNEVRVNMFMSTMTQLIKPTETITNTSESEKKFK